MRIAVVGAGVSGLSAAWLLSRHHEVHLFEAEERIGGHTHTHQVSVAGTPYSVDTGFIVFNRHNYHWFCRLLDDLGIESQPTQMSFSVTNQRSGLEYNATSLPSLFVQKRNLLRPRFWRMIREITRFYREAPKLLESDDPGPSTGEYLRRNGYSDSFRDDHLVPMAAALWSAPPGQVLEFPIRYMVQFFHHHRMLQVSGRPQWEVVKGGSSRYVERLLERMQATVHRATPIARVERNGDGVTLVAEDRQRFECDQVVMACHSDQALALLDEPSPQETEILGAMPYQENDVVLHTDTRLLPRRRGAWAAWNAIVPERDDLPCTVSYDMNILQGLQAPVEFVVTLNRGELIDDSQVIARMRYRHPVYNHQSVAAQARRDEINGQHHSWYCGAYWGWGFHEDGVRSAVDVAEGLGASFDHA